MKSDEKNRLVEIYASSYIDSEMVKGLLEDSGIKAFLKDGYLGTMAPWYAAAGGSGAVKVIVNSRDYAAARLIIEEYEQNRNNDS
ncbi:MAG TPA: DUF2007-related protein [Chitinophagales bacterium]|nr:DUF2007-related protein [Chitinophagales bacterium]